ncbi:MAG TPA: ArsR family transcriptional regulator [Ignisphaera aggregans]|uniref:ArsR family transcriptional regulator n=1 Tax=Ignisphaera aggregans TaxID=334771 RepID=A0A832YWY6_9CREN|nr:ArsR family transcriptional regulator [Ignisphaera aggregans]
MGVESAGQRCGKGVWIEGDVMYVAGEEFIERVASALASITRLRILGLAMKEDMGIEDLAEKLKQSKANISTHVKRLEEANLVKPIYVPGHRGIKKIAKPTVREIRIILSSLMEEVEERIREVPIPPEEGEKT